MPPLFACITTLGLDSVPGRDTRSERQTNGRAELRQLVHT